MKSIRGMLARLTRYQIVLVIAAVTLCGGLLFAQVAKPNIKIEAESGALNGSVATSQDSSASGGSLITFQDNTPPSGTTFTENFSSNLSHWTFGNWGTGQPGSVNPLSSATIVNSRAYIQTADRGYGDATLRADRMYDVRNGGTFSFDVSLMDGALPATGAFIGDPTVAFVDQPLNAPSYYDDNGKGTGPRNGGYYQFFQTCNLPWQTGHARQFINWVETVMPGETSCDAQVTITDGQLNRVELRYDGNNGWQLWASNAGTTAPLVKLRSFTMQIPEVGYFLIGSHNHESMKYSNDTRLTANATFDNISYPAASRISSSYRNGQNVVKGTADTAHVVFNACTPYPFVSTSWTVVLNGQTFAYTPQFNPIDPHSHCYPEGIDVPMSVVHDGNNTITFTNVTNPSNVDIVLTRNTP